MPAPRLLDKKLVNASLAQERKQEIDKGKKLVDSIQALQEAKDKETRELEEFRQRTLKTIQADIDRMGVDNERVKAENRALKEERLRLEAPIDLTQAWQEVTQKSIDNDSLADNLLIREIDVTERENDVHDALSLIQRRTNEVTKIESVVARNLAQTETHLEETQEAHKTVREVLSLAKRDKEEQDLFYSQKAQELDQREANALEREEQIQKDTLDITNQKRLLADRRATLERGFAELRRKQ